MMSERLDRILVLVRDPADLNGPLEAAAWIARTSGASILALVDPSISSDEDEIRKWVSRHAVPGFAMELRPLQEGLLEECRKHSEAAQRVLFLAGGPDRVDAREVLDDQTIRLIEGLCRPLLLFHQNQRGRTPWECIVVPMSGEIRGNRALAFSIELANQLGIFVDIVHVIDPRETTGPGYQLVARYGDAAHHELEAMIDEFITEACPFASPTEKRVIRNFHVLRGEATSELLDRLSALKAGVVAVEWKGNFMTGHAETLKRILGSLGGAVLLVRQAGQDEAALRAGHRLAG